jgi:hypothetical protein
MEELRDTRNILPQTWILDFMKLAIAIVLFFSIMDLNQEKI